MVVSQNWFPPALLAAPYLRFSSEKFRSVHSTFPAGTKAGPVAQVLGGMWKAMTPEEKQPYIAAQQAELAERDKVGDVSAALLDAGWKVCVGGPLPTCLVGRLLMFPVRVGVVKHTTRKRTSVEGSAMRVFLASPGDALP